MPEMNQQVLLERRPNGMPVPDDFAIVGRPPSEPGEGQVLLRGIYLSLDPYCAGGSAVSALTRRPPRSAMSSRVELSVRSRGRATPAFEKAILRPAATAGRRIASSMVTR